MLNKIRVSPDVDKGVLQAVLELVPEADRLSALRSHNILGSALQCAASRGENDLVFCVLDSLKPHHLHLVLKINKDDGSTIMHTCFYNGNTSILKRIFELVPETETVKLLNMKDTAEFTCIDYAVQQKHSDVLKLLLEKVSNDLLLQKRLIRVHAGIKDKSGILKALLTDDENSEYFFVVWDSNQSCRGYEKIS